MVRSIAMLVGVMVVAGTAMASDLRAPASADAEPYWIQERPLSGQVPNDVLAPDRRYAGGFGYGVNLVPPVSVDAGGGGGFVQHGQFSISNWRLGVDMLPSAAGAGRGSSVAQLAMNYGGQVNDNLRLSVGPTLSLGGEGLSPLSGAPSPGLRRLQGEAGLRDYGLRGSAVYQLGDRWALTGVLGYRRSLGELGVSNADEHFFSVLGLGYRF